MHELPLAAVLARVADHQIEIAIAVDVAECRVGVGSSGRMKCSPLLGTKKLDAITTECVQG